MSRTILRRVGVVLGVLCAVVLLAAGAGYGASSWRLNRTFSTPDEPLTLPTDPAAIERGRHFATTIGKCVDCHGENFGGKMMIDHPMLGRVADHADGNRALDRGRRPARPPRRRTPRRITDRVGDAVAVDEGHDRRGDQRPVRLPSDRPPEAVRAAVSGRRGSARSRSTASGEPPRVAAQYRHHGVAVPSGLFRRPNCAISLRRSAGVTGPV